MSKIHILATKKCFLSGNWTFGSQLNPSTICIALDVWADKIIIPVVIPVRGVVRNFSIAASHTIVCGAIDVVAIGRGRWWVVLVVASVCDLILLVTSNVIKLIKPEWSKIWTIEFQIRMDILWVSSICERMKIEIKLKGRWKEKYVTKRAKRYQITEEENICWKMVKEILDCRKEKCVGEWTRNKRSQKREICGRMSQCVTRSLFQFSRREREFLF